MTALSAALFLMKKKGALHAVDYDTPPDAKKRRVRVPMLSEISSEVIARDAGFTKNVLDYLPPQLLFCVMKAAIVKGHDRSVDVMLPHWPHSTFSLLQIWPDLYNTLEILYNNELHNTRMRQGIQTTNYLINAFLNIVKKKVPTKLRNLDLRGFPTVDLMVSVLAEEIISLQEAQLDRIAKESRLLPINCPSPSGLQPDEPTFQLTVDCAVRDDDTFNALIKALSLCHGVTPKIRLVISKLDVSCLGTSSVQVLLDHLRDMVCTFIFIF